MDQKQLQIEMWEYLVNRRKSIATLRDEMNRDLGNKQIELIGQARGLIKNIATVSMATLALVPSLLENTYIPYLIIGVAFQFFVVIVALSLLREDIDKDQNGLRDIKNRYNLALKDILDITDEYINLGPSKLSPEKMREHDERLQESDAGKKMKEENGELFMMWSGKKKSDLRFVGEFVLFLFLEGSLFLFFSVTGSRADWYILLILTILLYFLSLLPWADKVVSVFSKLSLFFAKRILKEDRSENGSEKVEGK